MNNDKENGKDDGATEENVHIQRKKKSEGKSVNNKNMVKSFIRKKVLFSIHITIQSFVSYSIFVQYTFF